MEILFKYCGIFLASYKDMQVVQKSGIDIDWAHDHTSPGSRDGPPPKEWIRRRWPDSARERPLLVMPGIRPPAAGSIRRARSQQLPEISSASLTYGSERRTVISR